MVFYGEVYLSDSLDEEFTVLVTLLPVSFDDLGTLIEVVPLTNV